MADSFLIPLQVFILGFIISLGIAFLIKFMLFLIRVSSKKPKVTEKNS